MRAWFATKPKREPRCRTCLYMVDSQCRRFPPLVLQKHGTDNSGYHGDPLTVWPRVQPSSFCGEWKETT